MSAKSRKPPKRAPKKVDATKSTPTDALAFPDPIETLSDMMFGFVFDGPDNPKAPVVKTPPDEETDNDEAEDEDEDEAPARPGARDGSAAGGVASTKQHFTFDFGGLFAAGRPDPASATRGGKKAKGKATRKQNEEPEDDDDGGDDGDEGDE